jgi:chemotaxis protein CheZ
MRAMQATLAMNPPTQGSAAASTEVVQQIGLITRQLHDALEQLGVMPKLQKATDGLPDARSRLSYIAQRCGEAAEKVLNAVDAAKAEQRRIATASRQIAVATGGNAAFAESVEAIERAQAGTLTQLTDIMMAQDYHDLTGQVVARVVGLVIDLEDSLVQVLKQANLPEPPPRADGPGLHGPVIGTEAADEVVANQDEVNDLLASLGF